MQRKSTLSRQTLTHHIAPHLLTGVMLVYLVLQQFSFLCLASDDSYIYAGYVKAINRGAIFSYNVGEHSGGTTGILFYYLLIVCYLTLKPLLFLWTDGATQLIGAVYLLNTILWCTTSFLVLEIFGKRQRLLGYSALLLAAANPRYLWGIWGGLEGSLMSCLLVYLLYLVKRSPAVFSDIRFIVTLVGLALGRPNWLPICATLGLPSLFINSKQVAIRNAAFGVVLFIALYSPVYFLTGDIALSALGSRVSIDPSHFDISSILQNLRRMTDTHWFDLTVVVALAAAMTGSKMARWCAVILSLDVATRAFFGLTDLNVHDRYVSFVWLMAVISIVDACAHKPRYAGWIAGVAFLGIAIHFSLFRADRAPEELMWLLVLLVVSLVSSRVPPQLSNKSSMTTSREAFISVCISSSLGICSFAALRDDIQEMNDAHALPAIWMSHNIPQTARVAMEPAGALRVWNDFYLIDLVGLTTSHSRKYTPWSVEALVNHEHPNYTFIYPHLFVTWDLFAEVEKCWTVPQRFSGGDICLYKMPPSL